jgi:hypothetical protein
VTADRSTVEGWLRKMEKAADEHETGDTWRSQVFRQMLNEAWADGRERGYDDARDDQSRAAHAVRTAQREATPARPDPEESP